MIVYKYTFEWLENSSCNRFTFPTNNLLMLLYTNTNPYSPVSVNIPYLTSKSLFDGTEHRFWFVAF